MAELVCTKHGPYDASHGSCPYCRAEAGGARPQAPAPLGGPTIIEGDLPIDIGAGKDSMGGPTGAGFPDDEAPTELGSGRGKTAGMPSPNPNDNPADPGKRWADDDMTEIDYDQVEEVPLGFLIVREGRRRGKVYKIQDGVRIGRNEGSMLLDDPKVSSLHAGISFVRDHFEIGDFASKNGTHVNGTRIKAATRLEENDEVKIGDYVFVFKVMF